MFARRNLTSRRFVVFVAGAAVCWMAAAPVCFQAVSNAAPAEPQNVEPETLPGPPTPVSPQPQQRAVLGASVTSVTDEAVVQFGVPVRKGALIQSLLKGSPADRAGLPLGGVIVSVDGQRVDSPEDLTRMVQASRPDQKIELKYYQGDRLFRKTVQLAPAEGLALTTPRPPAPSPRLPGVLGQGARRPVLDGVGRLIEQFVVPPDGQAVVPRQSPSEPPSQIAALQKQIESLQKQVLELQQKVAELEKRLSGSVPPPRAP